MQVSFDGAFPDIPLPNLGSGLSRIHVVTFHLFNSFGSSLFSVGEVNQEVKIWNSRTQEIEAGKDVCRTTE
jgi:hypothetical protein